MRLCGKILSRSLKFSHSLSLSLFRIDEWDNEEMNEQTNTMATTWKPLEQEKKATFNYIMETHTFFISLCFCCYYSNSFALFAQMVNFEAKCS